MDSFECPICFIEFNSEDIIITICNHKFCKFCYSKIIRCALCRCIFDNIITSETYNNDINIPNETYNNDINIPYDIDVIIYIYNIITYSSNNIGLSIKIFKLLILLFLILEIILLLFIIKIILFSL